MEAAGPAQTALQGGDFSLQRFIEILQGENLVDVAPVGESEQHFYQNINTPADLQKFADEQS